MISNTYQLKKPDQALAYQACKNANSKALQSSSLGAAAGAVCGKINGMDLASKTVLGHAAHKKWPFNCRCFSSC